MKNKNGNLERAMRKIKQFSDTKQWCGCLTPSEALALLDDGGKETGNSLYQRQRIQSEINNGKCQPHWFYFFPSKQQLKKLI